MSTLAAAAAGGTASSSSSTSSPRCVPFGFRRGGGRGRRLPVVTAGAHTTVTHGAGAAPAPAAAAAAATTTTTGGGGCCGRPLWRPAEVLGEGVQTAFFASLDVCSCVKLGTTSFRESGSSSEDAPLMSAAARSGGRSRVSSAGGKPRRGLGCCGGTSSNTSSVN